ncbi:MAG: hypothetical protein ACOX7L_00140 [Dethiobacteria bacterium]
MASPLPAARTEIRSKGFLLSRQTRPNWLIKTSECRLESRLFL